MTYEGVTMKVMTLLVAMLLAAVSMTAEAGNPVSFKGDIRPILDDYCLSCHVPGGKGFEKSKLDLSSYQSLMKGTQFGPVVKPGDSQNSTLNMLIEGRADPSISMPYGIKGSLSPDKVRLFKRWVDQGAKDN